MLSLRCPMVYFRHSMSEKGPRMRSEVKSQNGSIAEEIEEDIDEISLEADLLPSEKSAVSRGEQGSAQNNNILKIQS